MCAFVGAALGLAAALATPGLAAAQLVIDGGAERDDAADVEAAGEGDYKGVTPGEGSMPAEARRADRPVVTWVGYLADENGGSRLFLQLNQEVDVVQEVVGDKLYVTVAGARFGSRNTRRRIDLRFFPSSVAQVTGRQVPRRRRATKALPAGPAGALLAFEFKPEQTATTVGVSSRVEEDGYRYVYLDLPGGVADEP